MTNDLDKLTQSVTAFRSYAELTDRCREGYAPTLVAPKGKRGDAIRALATQLERDGFRVFRGLNEMTLRRLHAMTPKQRGAWYRRATAEQCEGLVVPCSGEAHTNAYVDHCMQCLTYEWGIALAPMPE